MIEEEKKKEELRELIREIIAYLRESRDFE